MGRGERETKEHQMPACNKEVVLEMDSPVQLPWLMPRGSEMD